MDSGSDINKDQYERPSVTSTLSVGPYTTRQFLLLVQDSQATRRKRVLRLLFVMCVPILVLILQCAVTMLSASTTKVTSSNTALAITSSVQVGEVITRLARERGMTSLFLSSKNSSDPWNNLVKLRASSDHAIAVVILWPGNSEDLPALRSPHALRHTLQTHRIDRSSNRTSISEVYWYAELIGGILRLVNRDVRLAGDTKGQLWRHLFALELFVNAKESLGIQRAIGSTIFSKGQGSTEEYNTFNENYFKARTFLEICFSHSGRSKALYDALLSDKADLTSRIASMRDAILQKQKNPPSVLNGLIWFANMTTYIDLISGLETNLVGIIQEQLDVQIVNAQGDFVQAMALLIVVVVCCPPLCLWYVQSVNKINRVIANSAKTLANQTKTLAAERRRGEKLLHRMLPPFIADALKRGDTVSAEHFEATTIYFSDIVGFTKISARSTPLQIVDLLNSLYSKFDGELDAHDVYKVETIGDAYMVVSGLPRRNGDEHAKEIAGLALDLRRIVEKFDIRHLPGEQLKIRIGLHTGPVLAGVVGRKMPRYCLFGSTVVRAEAIEQTGLPLKIHVSQECKLLLDRIGGFEISLRELAFIPEEVLMTKGQQSDTFWLNGRRSQKEQFILGR